MLHKRSFVKKTRKGNVLKVVREHYLRDDIPCYSSMCENCIDLIHSNANLMNPTEDEEAGAGEGATGTHVSSAVLEEEADQYLVLDTNVVLLQIDLLAHSGKEALRNVILPQTVVEEVKHRDPAIYKRIREIISIRERHFVVFSNEHHRDTYIERLPAESPNDRNDRAIRKVAQWYNDHLPQKRTLLLSNDRDNLRLASQQGIAGKTIQDYIRALGDPTLLDLLKTQPSFSSAEEEEDLPNKIYLFPKHIRLDLARQGIQQRKYVRGMFRAGRDGPNEGRVRLDFGKGDDIAVSGSENVNRAVDGDIVIAEILSGASPSELPDSSTSSSLLPSSDSSIPETSIEADTDLADLEGGVDDIPLTVGEDEVELPKPVRTGRIVTIVKRNWKSYVGVLTVEDSPAASSSYSLSPSSPTRGLSSELVSFVPNDVRLPQAIIKTAQRDQLKGKLVVVAYDSWERGSASPMGHLVKVLGGVGEAEAETEAILISHDIPYNEFSSEAMSCLPTLPWLVTEDEVKKRADFRSLRIASIDPPGCTDIDDALHHRILPNGNSEVGVHIADVTHFVQEDSALDREAWVRGNTVYLSNKRIDMLPGLLGTNLCSLRSNVDRYAFSVLWEMTPEGKIVDTQFTRSIIRSCASLTYQQAQERIDNQNDKSELTEDIRHLMRISRILKQDRINKGALTLASPEVKVVRDLETHAPIDVQLYQLRETNSLVEEFMLLANVATAQKIHSHFPQFSMLRRHPVPPPTNFDDLNQNLRRLGFELDVSSSKNLSDSLDRISVPNNEYFNTLTRILVTRCMTQAVYFSSGTVPRSEFLHYGLACDIYTHFTSPIRRYADVVVHRLLAACLGYIPVSLLFTRDRVKRLCDIINKRHHTAQLASRASTEFFTLIFFKDKVAEEPAYITRLKADGLNVLIPRYGYEGWIPLDPKVNGEFTFSDEDKCLTFTERGVVLRLFDQVKVRLRVETTDMTLRKRMCVECIQPNITGCWIEPITPSSSSASTSTAISTPKKTTNDNESGKKRKVVSPSTPSSIKPSPSTPANGVDQQKKKKKRNKK